MSTEDSSRHRGPRRTRNPRGSGNRSPRPPWCAKINLTVFSVTVNEFEDFRKPRVSNNAPVWGLVKRGVLFCQPCNRTASPVSRIKNRKRGTRIWAVPLQNLGLGNSIKISQPQFMMTPPLTITLVIFHP